MKTGEHEKSMNADPENIDGDPDTDIVKDITGGYVAPSAAANRIKGPGTQSPPAGPPPGVTKSLFKSVVVPGTYAEVQRRVAAAKVDKSMFKSASSAKADSPCAIAHAKRDKGPMWVGGKTSKEVPREEEGEYTPPGWSDKDDEDDKKKDVKKSLTELRYGSQLARNHDIGKSCGMCGRISKSCGDHDGGGCCGDCKKSMSSVNWHDSHLS